MNEKVRREIQMKKKGSYSENATDTVSIFDVTVAKIR